MTLLLEESSTEKVCPLLERFARDVLSENKPKEAAQNDLFYILIFVLMIENGFLPVINGSEILGNLDVFDVRQLTMEKLQVGLYKTEFVMSAFPDFPLKLIISPLGSLMLVNLIVNENNYEAYSVCLPISRYVVSAQASTIPLIFRDLKHLSLTFKNKVLSTVKSKVLSCYGYPSASLVGLPDDVLIFNVFSLLPIQSVLNVSKTCKRLKTVVANESLWREICKRDFKNLDSSRLSGWSILYKETYILKKEEQLRNSRTNSSLNNISDTCSFFAYRDRSMYPYNPLEDVI